MNLEKGTGAVSVEVVSEAEICQGAERLLRAAARVRVPG